METSIPEDVGTSKWPLPCQRMAVERSPIIGRVMGVSTDKIDNGYIVIDLYTPP